MSVFSSQGSGLAACANADVVNAPSAAAVTRILIENRVILLAPSKWSEKTSASPPILNKSRTSSSRQYDDAMRRGVGRSRLWDFPPSASRLCSVSVWNYSLQIRHRDYS